MTTKELIKLHNEVFGTDYDENEKIYTIRKKKIQIDMKGSKDLDNCIKIDMTGFFKKVPTKKT